MDSEYLQAVLMCSEVYIHVLRKFFKGKMLSPAGAFSYYSVITPERQKSIVKIKYQ